MIISFYKQGMPHISEGPRRVLVVEDDRDIASLVQLHLAEEGCEVTIAHDGSQGLRKALSEPYDLLILDLMLPGTDGIEICRRVRARPDYTPILMLTAKSAEPDRIVGLEMGADDYLTKPFSVRELLARIRALFRRIAALAAKEEAATPNRISADGLTITLDKRRVELDGRVVELTAKEFDLLVQFASHPGRVYTRSELLDLVWGYAQDTYQHTVNSHIRELFELAKLEAKEVRPEFESFSLPELVQDVVQDFQLEAEEKGVELQAHLSERLPFVRADIRLIERVLENLIGNALRYTPRGGVVDISLCQEDGRVKVEIHDSGCGIPADELPHIFERFHRVRREANDETAGSGLGLAIAKRILELHASMIQARSRLDQGTTFTFHLSGAA